MRYIKTFIILLCLFFYSCHKYDNNTHLKDNNLSFNRAFNSDSLKMASKRMIDSTEKLAKGSCYIELPIQNFNKYNLINGIPASDAIKVRAILYRVMSHVQLSNNRYVFTSKCGKELNISEDIYKKFKTEFENNNKWIAGQESKGRKIVLMPINSIYLNSLLNKNK